MNKRTIIFVTFGLLVSFLFWSGSRYPDLDHKTLMAKSGSVSDTLTTWPIFVVKAQDGLLKKTALTTVNWLYENRKGMAFGVFLGALLMSLFSFLKTVQISNRFLKALYGFFVGSPLGVCVNCAAPVFKGLLRSRHTEMALSAMLSSPTMNIVVLTMVFTLFPFYMGMVKLVFTIFVALVVVPFIGRYYAGDSKEEDTVEADSCAPRVFVEQESWNKALIVSGKSFASSLFYITKTTVPLMFVAGVLGAFVSHILPSDFNTTFNVAEVGLMVIIFSSLLGVFLPVPIAFDVLLVNALFSQGLPASISLVLLCTLGIFSVYSFFIIWTSRMKRLAVVLFFVITALGVVVGMIAPALHGVFYLDKNLSDYKKLRKELEIEQNQVLVREKGEKKKIGIKTCKDKPVRDFKIFYQSSDVSLSGREFSKSNKLTKQGGNVGFSKKEGRELGLVRGFQYGIRDYPDPFWIGRGTAAGDYNKDGWDDIAFGSNEGIWLYRNHGGCFESVLDSSSSRWLNRMRVYAVAFIDLNNDGWLDLFFTTYSEGNYLLLNKKGSFDLVNPIKVPNNKGIITVSPAFADLDGNGFLDVFNGNMALGIVTGFYAYDDRNRKGRQNSVVYTDFRKSKNVKQWNEYPLGGRSGETMSTLISDFNNDGVLDLYASNDFIVPDKVYLGKKGGGLDPGNNFLAKTPYFSMSADSGDLNNDLYLDLSVSGTIKRQDFVGNEKIDGRSPKEYAKEKWRQSICSEIKDVSFKESCLSVRNRDYLKAFSKESNLSVADCDREGSEDLRQGCLLAVMWTMITQGNWLDKCDQFSDELLKRVCQQMRLRGHKYHEKEFPNSLKQEFDSFVYLFEESKMVLSQHRHPGGWTWNKKIVDLDNDGWQDMFNAEGTVRKNDYGWNVLMMNQKGNGFEQRQFSYNVVDSFNLFSFSLLDFDDDGDMDIIGNSSTGPVQVYENNISEDKNSVIISLEDFKGNRSAVGAKVLIVSDSRTQIREIKASGGYMSFDPLQAHFGLDKDQIINKIEVTWPDSSKTSIKGKFPLNHFYKIRRNL